MTQLLRTAEKLAESPHPVQPPYANGRTHKRTGAPALSLAGTPVRVMITSFPVFYTG